MKLKVKNISNKTKTLKLLDDTSTKLQPNEELIVGNYSNDCYEYIFNTLKKGFEVSKVEDDYIIHSEGSECTPE